MPSSDQSNMASALDCQRRCAGVKGCAHFSFWPDGGCLLTDATSKPRAVPFEFSGTIAGPPSCHEAPKAPPALSVPVSGINGTECGKYPACVAVGIQGHCCPNRQPGTEHFWRLRSCFGAVRRVSLGCCDGFPLPKVISVPGTEIELLCAVDLAR